MAYGFAADNIMREAMTVSIEELTHFMNNDWLIKALKEMKRTELISEIEYQKLVEKRRIQELGRSFVGKIDYPITEHR